MSVAVSKEKELTVVVPFDKKSLRTIAQVSWQPNAHKLAFFVLDERDTLIQVDIGPRCFPFVPSFKTYHAKVASKGDAYWLIAKMLLIEEEKPLRGQSSDHVIGWVERAIRIKQIPMNREVPPGRGIPKYLGTVLSVIEFFTNRSFTRYEEQRKDPHTFFFRSEIQGFI